MGSTNDEAARERDRGAPAGLAVVADLQVRGRGRGGRTFASPLGGLYVSLLVEARCEDLPAPLTAAVAAAAAEAIESVAGAPVAIRWPNDLLVGGRKVGGILLEAAGADRPVVVGIGVNLRTVPGDLPPEVATEVGALDDARAGPVARQALLEALLLAVAARAASLPSPEGRRTVEAAWVGRLAYTGAEVTWSEGGRERRSGILRGASLRDGLQVEEAGRGLRWLRAEHVRDLRPRRQAPRGA